ncbi:MAG: hypothetical protein ACLFM1_10915 [Bacteroidales bacterium]
MNNTLLIIPTAFEAERIIDSNMSVQQSDKLYSLPALNTDLLICGPGLPASLLHTSRHLCRHEPYDFLIMAGIAGSNTSNLKAGDLTVVEAEKFADIGYQNNDHFTSLAGGEGWEDYRRGVLINEYQVLRHETGLPNVSSNTVNINNLKLEGMPSADIENMEGAGFFMLAKEEKIPYLEIRAISNPVKERDKDKWETGIALGKLTWFLNNYLKNKSL